MIHQNPFRRSNVKEIEASLARIFGRIQTGCRGPFCEAGLVGTTRLELATSALPSAGVAVKDTAKQAFLVRFSTHFCPQVASFRAGNVPHCLL